MKSVADGFGLRCTKHYRGFGYRKLHHGDVEFWILIGQRGFLSMSSTSGRKAAANLKFVLMHSFLEKKNKTTFCHLTKIVGMVKISGRKEKWSRGAICLFIGGEGGGGECTRAPTNQNGESKDTAI